jgi:hypothetical protein
MAAKFITPENVHLDWFGTLIDVTSYAQSSPVTLFAILTVAWMVLSPKIAKLI